MSEKTLYEILDVNFEATQDEISKAYRKIMREHHPDLHPGPEHEEIVRVANHAKSILLDEAKRNDYDKSLLAPEAETLIEDDEEWRPSWGEEETWGETLDDEIIDEPIVENNDFESAPLPNEPMQPVNPAVVPESLINDPVKFSSGFTPSLLAIGLGLISVPVIMLLANVDLTETETLLRNIFALVGIIGGVFLGVKFMNAKMPVFNLTSMLVTYASIFIALFVASYLITGSNIYSMIHPGLLAGLSNILFVPTIIQYFKDRKVLKPKSLKNSNSFGELDGSISAQLIDSELNPLWDAKGLRVFRVKHPSFSHVLMLGNKIAVIKGVDLHAPGVMQWSGPTLMNRYSNNGYTPVLNEHYRNYLEDFLVKLPKTIEVYPFIAVFPKGYMSSALNNNETTIVAGEDLAGLVAESLFNDKATNNVNHSSTVKVLRAVY